MAPSDVKKPEYFLVNDGTGTPPQPRGPQTIKDAKGNTMDVPYPPKSSCKKCYGRGYEGFNLVTGKLLACRKCYRLVAQP